MAKKTIQEEQNMSPETDGMESFAEMNEETTTESTSTKNEKVEQFKVKGEELLGKVKEIVKDGNAKRLIIKDKDGRVLVEFPLTFGVLGALFAPTFAAVGAIAALVSDCTIYVEKK